jgi:hypothetical protein
VRGVSSNGFSSFAGRAKRRSACAAKAPVVEQSFLAGPVDGSRTRIQTETNRSGVIPQVLVLVNFLVGSGRCCGLRSQITCK